MIVTFKYVFETPSYGRWSMVVFFQLKKIGPELMEKMSNGIICNTLISRVMKA